MAEVTTFARNDLKKHSIQGVVDTELVLSSTLPKRNKSHRLLWISVKFTGGTPAHMGITIEVVSGLGPDFDVIIVIGENNERNAFYQPEGRGLLIPDIDKIRVTAPAAGPSVLATIVIQMQEIE